MSLSPVYGEIPMKRHSSGYSSLHSCNCGVSTLTLPDPFNLAEAMSNKLIQPCCRSSALSTPFSAWYLHDVGPDRLSPSQQKWFTLRDVAVTIAFEFECDSGHRFFHNTKDPVAKYLQSESVQIVRCQFPPSDIPIALKCHECRFVTKTATARLRHIFVDTTSVMTAVRFRPRVTVRCRRPDYQGRICELKSSDTDFIDLGPMPMFIC